MISRILKFEGCEGAGFFVTIWIAAVMFKSNEILRKQTALKVLQMFFHTMNLC